MLYEDHLTALAQARAEERERCAVEAWSVGMQEYKGIPKDPRTIGSLIARRIRALSDEPEGGAGGPECPSCGSRNTAQTGLGGYQAPDASRGDPGAEGDEYGCNNCGRCFCW